MHTIPEFERWLQLSYLPDVTCSYLWISCQFDSLEQATELYVQSVDPVRILDEIHQGTSPSDIPAAYYISHFMLERKQDVQHLSCISYCRPEQNTPFTFSEDYEVWTSKNVQIVIRQYSRDAIITKPDDGGSDVRFLPEMLYLFAKGTTFDSQRKSLKRWYAQQFTSSRARVLDRRENMVRVEYVPYGATSSEQSREEMEAVLPQYPHAHTKTAEITLSSCGLPEAITDRPMFSRVWEYVEIGNTYYPKSGIYGGGNSTSGLASVYLLLPGTLQVTAKDLPEVSPALIPPEIRTSSKL